MHLLALLLPLMGCTTYTAVNPAFDLSHGRAQDLLNRMEQDPIELQRPVVYVGPFIDPGLSEWLFLHELRRYFPDDAPVAGLSFPPFISFDECRRRTVDFVQERFPQR